MKKALTVVAMAALIMATGLVVGCGPTEPEVTIDDPVDMPPPGPLDPPEGPVEPEMPPPMPEQPEMPQQPPMDAPEGGAAF